MAAWDPHLRSAGWQRTEGDAWHLFLARGRPADDLYCRRQGGQWVNRFAGMASYAVKSLLVRNLRSARHAIESREGESRFREFHPETFLLPREAQAWQRRAAAAPELYWLLKPQASSRGRGIRFVEAGEELHTDGDWLVQRAVDPHLMDGYKYGLRYYVLLASLDPLVAYVHRRGTCRVATRPFALDAAGRSDRLAHLINTAVQQTNPEATWWQRNLDFAGYYRWFEGQGFDPLRLESQIDEALRRTLLACREQALIESRAVGTLEGCFEFLGVDFQVDDRGSPWLLECNPAPPMEDEGGFDPRTGALFGGIKNELMSDLLRLLGLEGSLEEQAAERRLTWPQRLQAQRDRAGGWRLLWPVAESATYRERLLLRPTDEELQAEVGVRRRRSAPPAPSSRVAAWPLGQGLVLHDDSTGRLFTTNAAAAFVWSGLAEGASLDELVAELEGANPSGRETTGPEIGWRDRVWDLLVVWSHLGLLAGTEYCRSEERSTGSLQVAGRRLAAALALPVSAAVAEGWSTTVELPDPRIRSLLFTGEDPGPGAQPEGGTLWTKSAALDTLGELHSGGLRLDRPLARRLVAWLSQCEVVVSDRRPGAL